MFVNASKGSSHIFHGLALPTADHIGVKFVAAGQLGNGLLTTNRLLGYFGFEFGCKALLDNMLFTLKVAE